MLCQPHMIFISICWWFKGIVWASGPTSVFVLPSGYLKFKLHGPNLSREKNSYCNCYQDNITNTDWNLCEYKWMPLHFSRYSEFKSVQVGEYLIYMNCSLPVMITEEFIIKGVRQEFATTKILFLQIKLLLVFLQIYSVYKELAAIFMSNSHI